MYQILVSNCLIWVDMPLKIIETLTTTTHIIPPPVRRNRFPVIKTTCDFSLDLLPDVHKYFNLFYIILKGQKYPYRIATWSNHHSFYLIDLLNNPFLNAQHFLILNITKVRYFRNIIFFWKIKKIITTHTSWDSHIYSFWIEWSVQKIQRNSSTVKEICTLY